MSPVATSGPCKSTCRNLLPFLILLVFMTFCVAGTQMPILMVTLRYVHVLCGRHTDAHTHGHTQVRSRSAWLAHRCPYLWSHSGTFTFCVAGTQMPILMVTLRYVHVLRGWHTDAHTYGHTQVRSRSVWPAHRCPYLWSHSGMFTFCVAGTKMPILMVTLRYVHVLCGQHTDAHTHGHTQVRSRCAWPVHRCPYLWSHSGTFTFCVASIVCRITRKNCTNWNYRELRLRYKYKQTAGGHGFDPKQRYTKDVIKMVPDPSLYSAQHNYQDRSNFSLISFKK